MYENNFDTLQPCFDQESLQLHYDHKDGLILSMKTENTIEDFRKLEDIFDFVNQDDNHELIVKKTKK